MVQIQDPLNGINVFLIDRDPGKAGGLHGVQDVFPAVLQVDGHQIHPGREHLLHGRLAEADSRLQQVGAVFINDTLVLHGLDHGHQLVGGHGIRLRRSAPELGDPIQDPGDGDDQRLCDQHQQPQGIGRQQNKAVALILCHDLRHDLAKGKDQNGHDASGVDGAAVAHQLQRNDSRKR